MKHSLILASTASGLAITSPERVRGVVSARADSGRGSPDLPAVLTELNTAFAGFRERNDARLQELTETVENQQHTIDGLRVGGGGIHPGAGLRTAGRRFAPIEAEVASDFRAQLQGSPSAGMTTQSNPDGGFTVAPQIDSVIEAVLRDLSPMRSLARVVTLQPGRGSWEKILGRSGAQSAWAGEEDERSDTAAPVLGKVTINPEEVYAVPMLTNHVIEDSSFDLEAFLEEDVSGEFALTEGAAFVSGNGIKKPRGFLTYDTTTEADADRAFGKLQYVPTGTSGAFPAEDPADVLLDLVASLRPIYRQGDGVGFLMNSTTANVVRKFKDGQGNYLWTNSIAAGQPDRLCGYPVSLDEAMPDIGADEYAVAFGNWRRGYAVVDKPEMSLIVDRVTKKGWSKLYFAKRVGGGVVDSNAIKLLKFSAS